MTENCFEQLRKLDEKYITKIALYKRWIKILEENIDPNRLKELIAIYGEKYNSKDNDGR